MTEYKFDPDFARELDRKDELSQYREKFHIPLSKDREAVYFTGNSLGLQPRTAAEYLREELNDWAELAVEGHSHARRPWMDYHELFSASLASLVGGKSSEVVAMNGLTTNLHLLMVSFYRPQGKRYKILCEYKAFPSDQYALQSQARYHGYDPKEAIIEVAPGKGETLISREQWLEAIEKHREELALVMIGGVNYYTGQVMPMEEITRAGREAGAFVGWDLAHAAGNIPLRLHDWGVDFAAWCSYKYMNSGPGGVSGVFIHERHHGRKDIPRFEGWWGHNKSSRFAMPDRFDPIPTAEAWQLGNAPVMSMAPHRAALDLFDEVGMERLRERSKRLTAYLEFVIDHLTKEEGAGFEILTPRDPEERGCQISVRSDRGREFFDYLMENGVIADWREPDVVRMAPVPLYNSFYDIYSFGEVSRNYFRDHRG